MSLTEIHMLVNMPANCMNRDETGAPKTMFFNGTQRIRISSQCLKRAWRESDSFEAELGKCAEHTRYMPKRVADELRRRGYDETVANAVGTALGTDTPKDAAALGEWRAKNIGFYSDADINHIADVIGKMYEADPSQFANDEEKSADEKKAKKKSKNSSKASLSERIMNAMKADARVARKEGRHPVQLTVDQALFGRMVTDDSAGEIDAAMQVAHAMSTNPALLESDFFTAVDDFLKNGGLEEPPAIVGHLNSQDFDSACMYIHAVIDTDQLAYNLDSKEGIGHIVSSIVRTMALVTPSGHQNTYEAHVTPEVIYAEQKRDNLPVNLCNAFAVPISRDVAAKSAKALASEIDRMDHALGIPAAHRVWYTPGQNGEQKYAAPKTVDAADAVTSLPELQSKIESWEC